MIALLFRVGLESNLHGLVDKLPRAAPIWVGNVVLSGIPAYVLARHVLVLDLVPSLFVGVALTATSVAVSADIWREAKAFNSANGETLIDVAELDDLSGVGLMALLLAIAPVLHGGAGAPLSEALSVAGAVFALKVGSFGGACFYLARYGERHISGILKRSARLDAVLIVMGIGILIAATAALLGFSLAVGAFFAGLIFSRDPSAVKLEGSFLPLYAFFTPFFFIGIGLHIEPDALTAGLSLGAALLLVAICGKVLGAGGPALLATGWTGALLIGVSMVPRAEIAMVIVDQGRSLGDWAVPSEVYAGIALICLATSVCSPIVLRLMLRRWPQR